MKYVRTLDGQVLVVERNVEGSPTIQVTDTPWRVSDEDAAAYAAIGATVGVLVIAEDTLDGVPEDAVASLYRQLQATLAATADNAVRAELAAAAAGGVGGTTDTIVAGLAADPGSALAGVLADADAATRQAVDVTYGPRLSRTFADREFPRLVKPTAAGTVHAVSSAVEQSTGKINYPCIVKVAGLIPGALFNYYAFTSADHGSGPGGVYLHGFNYHGQAWTFVAKVITHPDAGALQCESPWVVYDDVTGTFRAYAQIKGTITGKIAGQVTCVWTSTDCQTWTYVGISHDVESTSFQGANTGDHTGYQKVAKIGGLWASRGLIKGTKYSRKANYYSSDGLRFYWDRTQVAGRPDIQVTERRILLDHFVQWNGVTVGYGKLRGNGPGGSASIGSFVMGRINSDGTDFAGRPTVIYAPAATGTTGENGDAADGHLFIEDGRAHLYYVSDPTRILYVTQEAA